MIPGAADLVGTPYREDGRDPSEGFDCRTLTWYVQERLLSRSLEGSAFWTAEDLDEADAHGEAVAHSSQWEEVPEADVQFPEVGWVAEHRAPLGGRRGMSVCVSAHPARWMTTTPAAGCVAIPASKLVGVRRVFRYLGPHGLRPGPPGR